MFRLFAYFFVKQAPKDRQPWTRLGLEQLGARDLPSANPFLADAGHFFGRHDDIAGDRAVFRELAESAEAASQSFGYCGSATAGATLSASLSNASGATGTASYNASTTGLSVSVQGAGADSTLDVAVDGSSVGSITTDASGNGKLRLDSTDTTVSAGSIITVGDLTGTFARTKYTATLTGSTDGVSGRASFKVAKNHLSLVASGLEADTTYRVLVDDTEVGQFTTNARGRARFTASVADLIIMLGSTISVTDLLGSAPILVGAFE